MARLAPVEVEQVAHELKVVLDVGLRAPKIRSVLHRLPDLTSLVGGLDECSGWTTATSIAELVTSAVEQLGAGPYGQAVSDLLGTRAATRGLPKARRRTAAADDLDTEVATFVRHWERDILLDVAALLVRAH